MKKDTLKTDCQKSKTYLTEHLLEVLGNSETSSKLLAKLSWTELSHLSVKMITEKEPLPCWECDGDGSIEGVDNGVWDNCNVCGGDGNSK